MKDTFFYRNVKDSDSLLISEWLGDKKLNQFLSSAFRKKHSKIFIKILFKKKDNLWYVFGNNKKIIGCVILDSIDHTDRIANIWYLNSNKNMHRKNLTYRAISQIIKLNELNLNSLIAWTLDSNFKSIKLLKKLKFKKIGEIEKTFFFKNKYQNRILFKRLLK